MWLTVIYFCYGVSGGDIYCRAKPIGELVFKEETDCLNNETILKIKTKYELENKDALLLDFKLSCIKLSEQT